MLEVGSIVDGKYKILNKIGNGGMSVVYLAMNERANKQWAIKEVRKDGVQNFEVIKQGLIVETDMLKRLSHPNLPSIVDVIDNDGSFLIVMDYIQGISLARALKDSGVISQDEVIEWAKQLCDVLSYLHSQKPPIIYRDMKPGNVMLQPDGKVKLIDFGTAREFKAGNIADTQCLGTKGYAAPEQFGGQGQTDERTDIYCLGATLYHLVTGHNPCDPPFEMYPIRKWNRSLSSGLEKIILKCTQPNPAERYQNCSELRYALDHYDELDILYKRKQTRKLVFFSTLVIASAGLFATSLIYKSKENNLMKESYDSYVQSALTGENFEKKVELYDKAIDIEPQRSEAYLDFLQNVVLEDNNMSIEEDEVMRKFLAETGTDGQTNEQRLQTNTAGYEELAYYLGIAYFYSYDGVGNKSFSRKWLDIAVSAGTLEEAQKVRASILAKIAGYYSKIGVPSPSGDAAVGYRKYWDDLTLLVQDNIADADNATTAMMIYKEIIYQIYFNAVYFKSEGVTKEEMDVLIQTVKGHVETDINLGEDINSVRLGEMIEELNGNIDQAERAVQVAFEER